jgi:hypothetical protein
MEKADMEKKSILEKELNELVVAKVFIFENNEFPLTDGVKARLSAINEKLTDINLQISQIGN